jgi:hypothetical protein
MPAAEYSKGTDRNKENDMEGSNRDIWSLFSCFSQHKKVSQIVFVVLLNACICAYFVAAVIFFIFQGKFNVI